MKLLAGWESRISQVRVEPPRPAPRVPLSARKLAGQTQIIRTFDDATRMVQFICEMPVSFVGMDTEYRVESSVPITLKRGKEWRDIRTIQPLCLAFAVVSDETLVRFALDLRMADMLPAVQQIIDLPVPFVCHHAPAELFVLWQLGLREPRIVWDTLLAEKALWLGKKFGSAGPAVAKDIDDIRRQEELEETNSRRLDLDTVARRYGIQVARVAGKQQLQASFLTKPFDACLTDEELAYCAQDAEIAALIREPQRVACDRAGIGETLDRVIMPWTVTAAEIRWTGVRFDRAKCRTFLSASEDVRGRMAADLQGLGITNPASPCQVATFLEQQGLAEHFPRTESGQLCTSDKWLEIREQLHPAIPLVRRYRKIRMLVEDPAIVGLIDGAGSTVPA